MKPGYVKMLHRFVGKIVQVYREQCASYSKCSRERLKAWLHMWAFTPASRLSSDWDWTKTRERTWMDLTRDWRKEAATRNDQRRGCRDKIFSCKPLSTARVSERRNACTHKWELEPKMTEKYKHWWNQWCMTMVRAEFERQGENRLTGWSQARPEGWSRDRPKELGGKRPAGWVQAVLCVQFSWSESCYLSYTGN